MHCDRIAHNFEPWLEIVLFENSFNQNVIADHLGICLVNYNVIVSGDVLKAELSRKDFCNNNNNNNFFLKLITVRTLFSHNKTKTQINYSRLQGVFDDQSSNKKKTLVFTKLAKIDMTV